MKRIAVCGVLLALLATAHAGDRRAGIVYGNFTPDAQSTPASKACFRTLEKKLTEDYTILMRLSETPYRKLVGKTAGESPLTWPKAAWDAAKQDGPHNRDKNNQEHATVDVALTIDCRPEQKSIDVVYAPSSGGVVTIRWRGIALDATALDRIGEAIELRLWAGFSP